MIGDSGECAITQDGCDEAAAVMGEYLDWAAENGGRTADIVLMLGDNAYNDATDSETTRGLFEPFAEVLRNHVLWPVPGNHEFGASDSPTQSGPYYEAFTLPKAAEAGGVASGTEAYYSYDYGNVHFVALDSHDTNRDAPDNAQTNICRATAPVATCTTGCAKTWPPRPRTSSSATGTTRPTPRGRTTRTYARTRKAACTT